MGSVQAMAEVRVMGWPQAIVIVLLTAKVIVHCCWHGSPRKEPFHWPSALVYAVLFASVLWWGGFWDGVA